jgi:phosphatidylglycerophosphate synthase
MNATIKKEYETSLKSIETENYLDRWFYRPLGFGIARALRYTGITPNMITVISIFVGIAVGPLFYCNSPGLSMLGILSFIIANILDCVDGQLARMTGIKSKIGRILDGLAGDIWFTLIYTFLALRLNSEFGTRLFFIPAILSGISHLAQAGITDYYKTLHLYFVSKEKGLEFQQLGEVRVQYDEMKGGISKALFFFYMLYTQLQEKATPKLQTMLKSLHSKYGDDIPENIRLDFRRKSSRLMKQFVDFMTFNGRTVVLFIVVIAEHVWLYFLFEIIILNIILAVSVNKHERICESITQELDSRL